MKQADFNHGVFFKTWFALWTRYVAIAFWVILAVALLLFQLGGRVNYTKSFPIGVYWTVEGEIKKGDLVLFCPPKTDVFIEAKKRQYITSGFCESGFGELMKKVVAVSGDTISINHSTVTVNNNELPNSANIGIDKFQRPMPDLLLQNYTLKDQEIFLMSDYNKESFDGRYFGVVDRTYISTAVMPIWTE